MANPINKSHFRMMIESVNDAIVSYAIGSQSMVGSLQRLADIRVIFNYLESFKDLGLDRRI